MESEHYNPFHRLVQKFASSQPGAWFGSHVLHHIDRAVYRLSGERVTLTSYIAGLPMVVVTTTGARSGQPRTIPLVAISDGTDLNRIALIASNWGQDHHPGWYHNLKANPLAKCTIHGITGLYRAHEASDGEYAHYWQQASETYLGYSLYQKRVGPRRIPIMVLEAETTVES
jgi:deazaflavin-dependent oxidoreductase (nitroreductase family)